MQKLLYLAKRIDHDSRTKNEEKTQTKYLGASIDNELKYQTEVKNLLSKIAQIVKCLYNLRECLPKKLLPVMINSLSISTLQYPAVLSSTIDNNLIVTVEK